MQSVLNNTNDQSESSDGEKVDAKHHISITMNPQTGKFEVRYLLLSFLLMLKGIPPRILEACAKQGFTEDMIMQNPMLLKDLLYSMDLNDILKDEIVHDISAPISTTHHISVRYNKETKKFEGIPEEVRSAFTQAGLTDQEIWENPEKVQDILKTMNLDEIIRGENFRETYAQSPQNISAVTKATHHISITYNHELGKFEGIPRPIIDAMAEKGIDENSIFAAEHTDALQEVLKTIKFDVLAGKGKPINVKAAMPVEKPNSQLSTVRGLSITGPTKTAHNLHVTYDQKTKEFKGIPESLMAILRKHGINSVTQENIQQVSTLLQSLDIPFDLSGQSKDLIKPDSLKASHVTAPKTPRQNIQLVVNSTQQENRQNTSNSSLYYYIGIPLVAIVSGYVIYRFVKKDD